MYPSSLKMLVRSVVWLFRVTETSTVSVIGLVLFDWVPVSFAVCTLRTDGVVLSGVANAVGMVGC